MATERYLHLSSIEGDNNDDVDDDDDDNNNNNRPYKA
jgi:hypothetical protein